MRHLMSRSMFKTNTEDGINIYLSKQGFDVNRPIRYEDGPTKHLVYAVADEPVPKKPAKTRKRFRKSKK